MSDESDQDTLHVLHAHIHMFYHSAIEHPGRHMPPMAFLLEIRQALEDDTFTMGKTVSHVGQMITGLTVRHHHSPWYSTHMLALQEGTCDKTPFALPAGYALPF
jgi:hypothetical protein